MSKIKLVLILLLVFGFYKFYQKVVNLEKNTKSKIVEMQDKAGIEREGNAIALLIFKSGQVRLIESYTIDTVSQCINLRDYVRKNKSLKYHCADVEAKIISGKIVKILKVNKVLK